MNLASRKLYGNEELYLTKIIQEKINHFKIDKHINFEWNIKGNSIIITPRQKVSFEDIFGMIDDEGEDWNLDEIVYND